MAHLARFDHGDKSGGHIARVRKEIAAVDLVKLDRFHAQSFERSIDRFGQIIDRGIVGPARPDSALGGDNHTRAQIRASGQRLAQQQFGAAKADGFACAVNVGGIKQGNPGIKRGLDPGDDRPDIILSIRASQSPHAPGEGKRAIRSCPKAQGRGLSR
jgi:hypothetical protein